VQADLLSSTVGRAGREATLTSSSGSTGAYADELPDSRGNSSWFWRGEVDGKLIAIYSMESTGVITIKIGKLEKRA
jgi:hypothetical protein